MPPTSPVLGRIKAYAKDASGNLYEIGGGSSVQNLDDLADVDVSTTPPQDGDTIVFDPITGKWVPGPGGTDEVMILGTTPTDPDLELWVDLNANQGPVPSTLQGGPGITIGTSADGLITEIRVDTGDGVIVNANGVSVNADMLTLAVDPLDDKLKLIAPIDALIDVDTTTTPPTDGQVLVWDSTALPAPGQWVPKDTAAGVDFVAGDGVIIDESAPPVVRFQVDVGAGIIHSPAGIRVNTDDVTVRVNTNDQLETINNIVAGPGIVADGQTQAPSVLVSVDTGAGIVHTPAGVAVNADEVTITVDPVDDKVKLKSPIPLIEAGPGIVADDQTNPPTVTISVDPGAGIVHSPDGIAVNTDGLTVVVNAQDQLEATKLDFQAGPGVVVDDTTYPVVIVQADTGEGIITTPNGLAVNVDNITTRVNPATDQLETISNIAAGPGITIDDVTNPPTATISVDTGSGIVIGPAGVMANVDNDTIRVNTSDEIYLFAPIDALRDVDTTTIAPVPGDGLVFGANPTFPGQWVPGAPVSQGLIPLQAVRAATDGAISLAAPPADVDGVVLVDGDRVLVKDQPGAIENGIYIANDLSAGGWVRSPDADAEEDLVVGNSVLVSEGLVNGTVSFIVALSAAELPWTPDVDQNRWYASFSKLDVEAGMGLTMTGKVLDVGAGPGLVVGADTVQVDSGAGISVGAGGVQVNTDDVTIRINANDQLEAISNIVAGPGIVVDDDTMLPGIQVSVDPGAALENTPDGVAVKVDDITVKVNATDQLEVVNNLQAGAGIVVDKDTQAPLTVVHVDPGAALENTPDGVAVKVDNISVGVSANDELEVISQIVAGGGITVGQAPGVTEIAVNTGAGIVQSLDGIAANVDGVSILVNAADQLEVTNYVQAVEPAGPWMFWTDISNPVPIP